MIQTLFFKSLKVHFFESLKTHFFESLKTHFFESLKNLFFEKMDPFLLLSLWSFLEIVYTIWPNTVSYLSKNRSIFWKKHQFFSMGIWTYNPHFYGKSKRPFSENSKQYLTKTIYFSEIIIITNLGIVMHENQTFINMWYYINQFSLNLFLFPKYILIRNSK